MILSVYSVILQTNIKIKGETASHIQLPLMSQKAKKIDEHHVVCKSVFSLAVPKNHVPDM